MIKRALEPIAFSDEWGRQMRFITGPRQCGKTTLAREKLKKEGSSVLYYLWDLRSVRDRYKGNPLFFTEDAPPRKKKAWACFDEIHKYPAWKNVLKGIFDSSQDHYQFVITGSAKFDIFRRSGDSLAGRYFTFHLYPLGLWEISRAQAAAGASLFSRERPTEHRRGNGVSKSVGKCPTEHRRGSGASKSVGKCPAPNAEDFIATRLDGGEAPQGDLNALLKFGGFPEPFSRQSEIFCAKWRRDYADAVVREDIGALTRILEREKLHDLYHLLPQMVGNPLSEASLASHLELSPPTIKNHLRRLEEFYLLFRIRPYFKNVKRALLKAPKAYLYDWTLAPEPGARFENFVAAQLWALLSLWSENSLDIYSLFYVRTRENLESDFLIAKNQRPYLLIETKLTDAPISSHHFKIRSALGNIPLIQLCATPGVCALEAKAAYRMSAARFFSGK